MAYIDCENCYHGEVCTYRRASHNKIVLCEHWQPAADVVEVKRGEWVMDEIAGMKVCSECKGVILGTVFGQWLFVNMETMWCPHCGADMRGDK